MTRLNWEAARTQWTSGKSFTLSIILHCASTRPKMVSGFGQRGPGNNLLNETNQNNETIDLLIGEMNKP